MCPLGCQGCLTWILGGISRKCCLVANAQTYASSGPQCCRGWECFVLFPLTEVVLCGKKRNTGLSEVMEFHGMFSPAGWFRRFCLGG